jgi:hypothetical protein
LLSKWQSVFGPKLLAGWNRLVYGPVSFSIRFTHLTCVPESPMVFDSWL